MSDQMRHNAQAFSRVLREAKRHLARVRMLAAQLDRASRAHDRQLERILARLDRAQRRAGIGQ